MPLGVRRSVCGMPILRMVMTRVEPIAYGETCVCSPLPRSS